MALLNIQNITSIKFGDIQEDGTFPTSLDGNLDIKEGTGVLTIPVQDVTSIYVEQSAIPFTSVAGNVVDPTFVAQLLGASTEQIATLYGGAFTAADATNPEIANLPVNATPVFKAVEIAGQNSAGEPIVFQIPRSRILLSFDETITKTDSVGFTLNASILKPLGAAMNFVSIRNGSTTS